jgi:peptidoglycan/xylan/chitin deacetylase (PgdA/CDA1 family)
MKKLAFALLYLTGVTRLAAWWHRRRVIFVCYHGVTKRTQRSPNDPTGLHVNHQRFAAQLDFLAERYHFISLDDYLRARLEGRRLPDYSILLTFDDGFRNFLTVATPVLAPRRIPATVFLITGNADARSDSIRETVWQPEDDDSYLSWREAKLLKEKYQFDFGSHTCSHSPLLSLARPEIQRELSQSREALARELAVQDPALSYPKGERSQMLAEEARNQGYSCAVTTDRGANEMTHNPFTLGRTLVGDADDNISLAVRVSGVQYWLVYLRDLVVSRPAQTSSALGAAALQSEATFQLLD